jgi:DNA gyrase subunit B
MPVRGKILNCLKADYNKIFANEIITDLVRVLGCGVEIKGLRSAKDMNSFDMARFNWNKVIICTDADYDGYQIRTLVLTMLYRLMPTIIAKGRVYIAESPLFEITSQSRNTATQFAYTDKEKNEIVRKLNGKCKVQRSKGLGENEPEMMSLTTMNPATRRLISVVPEDEAATFKMFDILLGDNLSGRKKYIEDYGWEYIDLTEVV